MQHYILLEQTILYSILKLFWTSKTISHGLQAHIQGQTHHELAIWHKATSLDNV